MNKSENPNEYVKAFFLENGSEELLEKWNEQENQEEFSKLIPKTTKLMQDTNKPKKNKCAYIFFCAENRSKVNEELGNDAKATEVTSALGAKWTELKNSTKASDQKQLEKYEAAALADRKRYEEENGGIYSKKCQCGKAQPCFNEPGEKIPICCGDCKTPTMENVKDKKCQCGKAQPTYNEPGEKIPICCFDCKTPTMKDVKNKKCQCGKARPSFNEPGEKIPICCFDCKTLTMENVVSKKCQCGKAIPTYNEPGEKKAICCFDCKTPTMEDVYNKKCQCGKARPSFNEPGEKIPICCGDCKTPTMENVVSKKCLTPFCGTLVSNKMYEGYCTRCFMFTFPDKPIARNYKTKEMTVVEYVKSEFPNVDWISDKRVSGGCSLRRPDLLLDLGNKVIIIEIDENGHRDYDCSCEHKRMMEISLDLGHRPIIFIRFNPDSYMKNNKKVTSCWSVNKNGICAISKNKKKEWTQRLNSLTNQISYWLKNDTDKTVETIELYFDDVV